MTIDPFTVQTVEVALKSQAPRAIGHVRRLRNADPNLSEADILRKLERKLIKDTFRIGRAAGAAAASQDPARAATIDTSTGKATLEAAVFFVIAVAEAHEIPLSELGYREELVRSVLLAKGTDNAIHRLASRTAPYWARKIVAKIPASSFKPINKFMGPNFITKSGQSGVIVIDELAEREVGSAIGVTTNVVFAGYVILASRRAFGSSEPTFDHDDVIVEEDTDEPDDMVDRGTPGPVRG